MQKFLTGFGGIIRLIAAANKSGGSSSSCRPGAIHAFSQRKGSGGASLDRPDGLDERSRNTQRSGRLPHGKLAVADAACQKAHRRPVESTKRGSRQSCFPVAAEARCNGLPVRLQQSLNVDVRHAVAKQHDARLVAELVKDRSHSPQHSWMSRRRRALHMKRQLCWSARGWQSHS
jgi:hypothetical protein